MVQYDSIIDLLKNKNIMFLEDEPMSRHTSFKIGGNCKILAYPNNVTQVQEIIKICHDKNISNVVLGRGSNLLVSDFGFDGIAICSNELNNIKLISDTEIYCESGVNLPKLCNFALKNSLSGLEFACGIPGSVGGAIFMNAGAYGGEMKDIVQSVKYMDDNGQVLELKNDELDFSYRHSFFEDRNYFILSATIRLCTHDKYDIKSKMKDLLQKRKNKQPLEFPSAGSAFKRPKVGYAAALIEECGLKGKTVGGAQISNKHSGFIVNVGNATCEDVNSLILETQKIVKNRTGIWLEPEIKFIGDC